MKLRVAIKICRSLHGYTEKDIRKQVGCRWKYGSINKAHQVCRRGKRWLKDKRLPYIPSDSELDEQAEIRFCIFEWLAEKLVSEPKVKE